MTCLFDIILPKLTLRLTSSVYRWTIIMVCWKKQTSRRGEKVPSLFYLRTRECCTFTLGKATSSSFCSFEPHLTISGFTLRCCLKNPCKKPGGSFGIDELMRGCIHLPRPPRKSGFRRKPTRIFFQEGTISHFWLTLGLSNDTSCPHDKRNQNI